ncbi:ABC transporter permease subunit [Leucothrix sargassi]|nr:ABC transporter permease subunit [Leucothrix sargassi]
MKRLINLQPNHAGKIFLGLLPFVALIILYMFASQARLEANAADKLLPAFSKMANSMYNMAFEPSKRSGEYLLWVDTLASLQRLALAVLISALIGLIIGIANGAIPLIRSGISPLVTAISLVPPMAILPILFIVFGLGELSKVMLIVIGITPFLARDMQQRVLELPEELLIKAQTLGGNSWQIIVRIILPQVLPRLFDAVRLSLGSAWLFLIAAEAIAATEGLGYRIFLVRRYLSMDVILPYVLWITLLAFLADYLLRLVNRRLFPWYQTGGSK